MLTITIGISLLVYLVVGSYAGRGVKKLDDYFVAGRRAPTLLILGTLVASVMSTAIFMGEAAFTYDGQLGAYLLFPGIAVTGYLIGALFFGVYLRRSRAPTVADYFGRRFQSRALQQFAGFTIILGLGGYLLIVTQGAALLLADITGISFAASLGVAWLGYTVFTMYSGSRGVIITDTLMFLLFMGATIVFVVYIVDDFGGVSAAVSDLTRVEGKEGIASWTGIIGEGTSWPTALDYVIWAVVVDAAWAFVYAVGPWQASRHLMARDEHVVLRAAIFATFCVIVLQMLVYAIGGFINLANPSITPSETVIIWAAQSLVPEMLGAVLLTGIVAAALSSASTFLSLVGFSIGNDMGPRPLALTVNATRKIILATSVLVLVCCYFFPPNIFWFMLFIGTVFASSWGPVGMMSVWSRRITKQAALWGMVSGFFMNVIPATVDYLGWYSMPEYYPPVIGTVASLVVIVVVSAFTRVTREERVYQLRLHRPPASDIDLGKLRTTLLAPLGLIAYGVTMPFLLLHYYVIPYQIATGEISADGSVNWDTGEALISVTVAMLHIPLALMAMKIIWDRYNPNTPRNKRIVQMAANSGSSKERA
ncbi:Na+/solute symporter [Luminiphilus syltensis NOR5-1B]|uniref:Na+/solute symporter n=1 Tax=Luminiphilus syltensis NOR5-1B TaxID=565045 RepID=B8KU07_9GAMM|nr:sodium:solute symporter family protein [Luminiphilus syltensis]EED34808.1 Na+/solute symporter [Luminiphilus syltensis NOR5-1B]